MNRIKRILEKDKTRESFENQNSLWPASLASSLLILAFMLTLFWANAQADVNEKPNWSYNSERKMAVGFVAIPPNYKEDADKKFGETAERLIEKLKQNKVPAIGFVTGSKIYKNGDISEANVEVLRMWRDAGLEIGVGGYDHIRFSNTDYNDYVANVEKNIEVVKPILAEKNRKIEFFSYPFLNTGRDLETKIRFENWLSENGLKFVPYTFDNQEWMYSYAYDAARKQNNPEMMREIKREFLAYMEKMVRHFEGYSNELFGREIPQTLVLTTSRLVADSSDELFGMFRNRGYEFISMEEALKDKAYRETETFAGQAGISWLERWTMTRGQKPFNEPEVDELVEDIWQNRNGDNPLKNSKMPVPSATPPPPLPPAPPAPPAPPKPPAPSTLGMTDLPPKPPKPPAPPRAKEPKPPTRPMPPGDVPPPPPSPPAPPTSPPPAPPKPPRSI